MSATCYYCSEEITNAEIIAGIVDSKQGDFFHQACHDDAELEAKLE